MGLRSGALGSRLGALDPRWGLWGQNQGLWGQDRRIGSPAQRFFFLFLKKKDIFTIVFLGKSSHSELIDPLFK